MEPLIILEYSSVFFGFVYVVLAAYNKIWCWLFGILQSVTGAILMYKINLYSESTLYLFYIVMAIYGWYNWSVQKSDKPIVKKSLIFHSGTILTGVGLSFLLYYIFNTYTDADKTAFDAFTTAFAIITTFLVVWKVLYNWLYWIVINGLTIYLYQSKGLDLYATFSVLLTLLSVYGLYLWLTLYKNQNPEE